jgi:hypothetical protein
MDLSGYQDWLTEQGYQPSTIEATLRHLKNAVGTGEWESRRAHLRRYLLFVKKTRRNPLGKDFAHKLKQAGYEPASEIAKQGKTAKQVLTTRQWRALRARLREKSANYEAKLLAAYMESPYRIGDFLNLRIIDMGEGDTDKPALKWLEGVRAQSRKKKMFVYEVLCDTERCAYYRLRKKLRKVTEDMGLDVDLDTLYKSYFAIYGD